MSALLYVAAFLLPFFCRTDSLPLSQAGNEHLFGLGIVILLGAIIIMGIWAIWDCWEQRAKRKMLMVLVRSCFQIVAVWIFSVAGCLFAGANIV